jgi:hypothetical protein
MKLQLSLKRVLVDGTLMSVLLTIITFGSIYVNPLMLVDSYTPDVRAAVGEVDLPALQLAVFYVLSFGTVAGVILHSNAGLRRENSGNLTFWTASAHSALLMFFFAVWDLLIMDWLIFVTIQPAFVVIPGTEGFTGYGDYWFHFEVSFLGPELWLSVLIGGLIMGGLSMVLLGGKLRAKEPLESDS